MRSLIVTCLVTSAFANILDAPRAIPGSQGNADTRNFAEITAANGYQSEEHNITTEDGYILTAFRISSKKCDQLKPTPVLLIHGLFQSADSLLDVGSVGYPYLLADECYDVWAGNCRGNYYGRAHTKYNPDTDREFWKFSTDEIGIFDMPAHIDYVLEQTGAAALNYVGYSQGGGVIFITCSEKPEYNSKINLIVGISPGTRITNTKSPLVRLLVKGAFKLEDFVTAAGIEEVFSRGQVLQTLLEFLCNMKDELDASYPVCDGIINLLDPYHIEGAIDPETMKRLYAHFPAGTSVRLVSRFGQSLSSEYFQKYDYGCEEENLVHYNSSTPPIYDVSKVTVPVVITYGENDRLVVKEDVTWLKDQLPNVLDFVRVADDSWIHLDNAYNRNLSHLVYRTVSKYLAQYTDNYDDDDDDDDDDDAESCDDDN